MLNQCGWEKALSIEEHVKKHPRIFGGIYVDGGKTCG
jgi:hypothetical protein